MKQFYYGACVSKKYVFIQIGKTEKRFTADEAEQFAKGLLEYVGDVRTGRERVKEEIEEYRRKHG